MGGMEDHDKRGFYRLLESTPNCSSAEIRRRYRRLALQHHPDVEPDANRRRSRHTRMQNLNEAYETLRDPDRRSAYDQDCGFPRCSAHPSTFLAGICARCGDAVCPDCCDGARPEVGELPGLPSSRGPVCRPCSERSERRRRTRDPVERALLALEDGELDEAQRDLNRALLVNPRDVVALTALSTVREKRGDLPAAALALEMALRLKPEHAFSHYRLGKLHQRLGNEARARAAFDEAVRLNPGDSRYRGAIAMLDEMPADSSTARFRPNDQVRHDVFGQGVVTEVTPVGVRVAFEEGGHRWLDPGRAPMVRRA